MSRRIIRMSIILMMLLLIVLAIRKYDIVDVFRMIVVIIVLSISILIYGGRALEISWTLIWSIWCIGLWVRIYIFKENRDKELLNHYKLYYGETQKDSGRKNQYTWILSQRHWIKYYFTENANFLSYLLWGILIYWAYKYFTILRKIGTNINDYIIRALTIVVWIIYLNLSIEKFKLDKAKILKQLKTKELEEIEYDNPSNTSDEYDSAKLTKWIIDKEDHFNEKNKLSFLKSSMSISYSTISICILGLCILGWANILLFRYNDFNSSWCSIKWNIEFSTQEKIYHLPNCESYSSTIIDSSYWEKRFCSEKEAKEAGWRKAYNC